MGFHREVGAILCLGRWLGWAGVSRPDAGEQEQHARHDQFGTPAKSRVAPFGFLHAAQSTPLAKAIDAFLPTDCPIRVVGPRHRHFPDTPKPIHPLEFLSCR